jgi:hypothetical protein
MPVTALGLCCQPVNSVVNFLAKTGQHEAIVICILKRNHFYETDFAYQLYLE